MAPKGGKGRKRSFEGRRVVSEQQGKKRKSNPEHDSSSPPAATSVDADNDLSLHPRCPHGPTILFCRDGKEFFACSAARDRKDCAFFLWRDEMGTSSGKKVVERWKERERSYTDGELTVIRRRQEALKRVSEDVSSGRFCNNCQELCFRGDEAHAKHDCQTVSKESLQHPTKSLMQQRGCNKKEAQYHFTQDSIRTLSSVIEKNGFTSVLCIGAPTLFEHLKNSTSINCILLDIDTRFASFFEEGQEWLWYNVFNRHFFSPKGKENYRKFLSQTEKLAIVIDPPFGGRCELLSKTLIEISSDWCELRGSTDKHNFPKYFWAFPYFMERKLTESDPCIKMAHYVVNYDNHNSFQDREDTGSGRKHGSPVRFFTNLDLCKFDLSDVKGYRWCDQGCECYVREDDKHCLDCDACTSKSGAPYRHCQKCRRCVKQTWAHCKKCQRCALPNHPCQKFQQSNHK